MAAIALEPRGTCRSLSPLPTQRAVPFLRSRSPAAARRPRRRGSRWHRASRAAHDRGGPAASPCWGQSSSRSGGGRAQDRRQTVPDHRGDQQLGDVLGDLAFEHQEAEERREARQVPAYAARRKKRAIQRVDVVAQRDCIQFREFDGRLDLRHRRNRIRSDR